MSELAYLVFDGLTAPVVLRDCPEIVETISGVMPGWHFEVLPASAEPPFIAISRLADASLNVSLANGPAKRLNTLNAVCELIACMAQELLRSQPYLLCLHAAAVEISGRLVVFPSTGRAGKSTLMACLAARGLRVFTDDYLPLESADDGSLVGRATGVQTRLRLPMPPEFSPELRAQLEARFSAANSQYVFLRAARPVPHGAASPVGAIVFLERAATAETKLLPAKSDETIDRLLKQNFARGMHSADILSALDAIARTALLFHLQYASAESAAELLENAFGALGSAPVPQFALRARPVEVLGTKPIAARAEPSARYAQAAGLSQVTSDRQCYLTDPQGVAVHRLNEGAMAVWELLEEAMSANDIADLLHDRFPATPRESIRGDTLVLLDEFLRNRLIVPASDCP